MHPNKKLTILILTKFLKKNSTSDAPTKFLLNFTNPPKLICPVKLSKNVQNKKNIS